LAGSVVDPNNQSLAVVVHRLLCERVFTSGWVEKANFEANNYAVLSRAKRSRQLRFDNLFVNRRTA
jgi:hypothetical protein